MNLRTGRFLTTFTIILLLTVWSGASASVYQFVSVDTFVTSRDVDVPVTYVQPVGTGNETFPLVVMAHGHGGSRNESGSFKRVAEDLARRGIASIRMDFPGCGESTESFAEKKAQAVRDGSVPFTTQWGQDQVLGAKFFTDMEESNPLDQLRQFEGSLFVLYGDHDDVVLPDVAETAVSTARNAVEVVRYIVKGADHGLGIFSNEPHYTDQAVSNTVGFIVDRLRKRSVLTERRATGYAQDVRYFAIEHMDVRREAFQVCTAYALRAR